MTQETVNRVPRFLCITSKGGAGKSTIAQQVCATWLLTRLGPDAANLIELDDQNLDSRWLTDSQIKAQQIKVEGDATYAVLELFRDNNLKPFVLDVGNQTAPSAIKAMGKSKRLSAFDAIFVPVRDIGQDLKNAKDTVKEIFEADKDSKIVIVLNGIPRASQDPNDRRTKFYYEDIIKYAKEQNFPLIIMPAVEGYGMCRNFGMSFIEIDKQAAEMTDKFNTACMQYEKEGNADASHQMMSMSFMVGTAEEGAKYVYNLHKQIDDLIGWEK